MNTSTDLRRFADLTRNLLRRELRSRYKRSTLGWTWSLINPLSSVVIYTLVFAVILDAPVPEAEGSGLKSFPLFLLCGLIPWNLFAASLVSGTESLVANASLIKKVYFPRQTLVLAVVGSVAVTSLVETGVLSVILLIAGNMVLPWLPIVVMLLALEVVLTTGIALAASIVNVYLRDLQHLVTIGLQLLFYATPIIYDPSLIPDHQRILGVTLPLRSILELNPFAALIGMFRDVLYHERMPQLGDALYVGVWAVGLLVAGHFLFRRYEARLAEEL